MVQQDFDREYERATALLPEFGEHLKSLLKLLLDTGTVRIHRIDSRVKGKKSTELKLARPRKGVSGSAPRTLDTITDLLGIRIITYYTEDVDQVAEIITGQFTIDQENSVDKRALLEADQFGYLSLHYVAELNPSLTGHAEYQRYRSLKFEIQIRSILQHAWAEIEHDLGYKSEAALPRAVRRAFAQISNLLEVADEKFVGIRTELGKHQDETKATIEGGDAADEILIDQDSLAAFVRSNNQVARLDALIARARHVSVQDHIDNQFLGYEAGQLVQLGLKSIEDLSNYLDKNAELLARFVERWLASADGAEAAGTARGRVAVPIGITLYYAGALRYAQGAATGQAAGRWEYTSNTLRRALREATRDGGSSATL